MIFKIGKSMKRVSLCFQHGLRRERGELGGRCKIEIYLFRFCILDIGFTRYEEDSYFSFLILGFGFVIHSGQGEF